METLISLSYITLSMDFYCPYVSTRRYFARPSTKRNSLSSRCISRLVAIPTAITFTNSLVFFPFSTTLYLYHFPFWKTLFPLPPISLFLSRTSSLLLFPPSLFPRDFLSLRPEPANPWASSKRGGSFRNVNTSRAHFLFFSRIYISIEIYICAQRSFFDQSFNSIRMYKIDLTILFFNLLIIRLSVKECV